jgi:hypothetical protein
MTRTIRLERGLWTRRVVVPSAVTWSILRRSEPSAHARLTADIKGEPVSTQPKVCTISVHSIS